MEDTSNTTRELEQDREAIRRAAPDGAELDALFARVAGETVDRKPSRLERLRELPTPWRIALAITLSVLVGAGLLAAMGIRPDLTRVGVLRYVSTLSFLVATVSLAVALSLRGPHQRPVGRWAWWFVGAALLLPLALAFVPSLWTGALPQRETMAGPGFRCLALGLATAGMVGGLVRVLQRDTGGPDWRIAALGGAGGLVAFTTVEHHCASTDLLHLIIGHGLVGLAFAGILWGYTRLRETYSSGLQ